MTGRDPTGLHPTGFDPSRIKQHLLERYCDERCAQVGDVGCWAIAPDEGFCAECIDDADLAIEFVGQAMAIEAAREAKPRETGRYIDRCEHSPTGWAWWVTREDANDCCTCEPAIATEARRAETTGSACEGAGRNGIAQKDQQNDPD